MELKKNQRKWPWSKIAELARTKQNDDKYLWSVRDDLERKLTEEGDFYVERVMLRYWVESLVRYVRWYEEACCDFTLPLEQLLDPPAVCLRPDRKDLKSQFHK